VLGGDVTGKVMVPIIARGGGWDVTLRGEKIRLETRAELEEIEKRIRDRGSYPAVVTPDELDSLHEEDGSVDRRFSLEMVRRWTAGWTWPTGSCAAGRSVHRQRRQR